MLMSHLFDFLTSNDLVWRKLYVTMCMTSVVDRKCRLWSDWWSLWSIRQLTGTDRCKLPFLLQNIHGM